MNHFTTGFQGSAVSYERGTQQRASPGPPVPDCLATIVRCLGPYTKNTRSQRRMLPPPEKNTPQFNFNTPETPIHGRAFPETTLHGCACPVSAGASLAAAALPPPAGSPPAAAPPASPAAFPPFALASSPLASFASQHPSHTPLAPAHAGQSVR